MATNTKKKIEISNEHLQLLRDSQFKPEAPVYEQDEVICTVPSGDYDVSSKDIPASAGNKPWTAYEASFKIGKDTFVQRYRSGVVPDEDGDLAVSVFKANRDFTTPNGRVIKKGDMKVFSTNA